MISPVTCSGEVVRDRLVRDLPAAPQHDDPVGHCEHVGHAMADQHDRVVLVAQPADEVEDFRDLAHADGGRGLVHQHDLGRGEAGARDRHRLPLAAGHLADEVPRPRLRLELGEQARRRGGYMVR